ncbi:FMN-binding glutamate synthase family protein [Dehalococcoidia bacterium]|nr:FMN-binding glutamate synthase family protein [Dehalococcoidia bacterium]MCL0094251.1 FMN-binding glutamate synthase family protein [Dehalococcoidia bacterium]
MTLTRYNATASTLTKNRTGGDWCPVSGMCVTCVEGCVGMCEIGRSAYRGHEVIYPQPFGIITTASQKDYPVDLSHFNVMGSAVGAVGIEADSDKAIFPNVNLETRLGQGEGIKLRLPFVIPGLGSTDVAEKNWDGLAIGAALTGTLLTIGENVCGMDVNSRVEKGRVIHSPDLERRVKLYQEWQRDSYGAIVVQANVEDSRLGVLEYAIEKLGVEAVELKWGQGAKDIGGEVKINSLEKAQLLKKRGYIVLPDPLDPARIDEFHNGTFTEFERHSRIGMVSEEGFLETVSRLRSIGAKYISLKTGAYRPADLARAVKFCSLAKIDYLTVDAAGGGTGMSPWRMMNEWGVPGIELWSLLYQYCNRLAEKGEYVPDVVLAGGYILEDQIFKGLALGAPYVKAIGMARAPLAAVMVGKTLGQAIDDGQSPVYLRRFGKTRESVFVTAEALKREYGKDYENIPTSAIGLYTYYERLAQGLRQLMAGSRKFALKFIDRSDIVALTRQAAEISGIAHVMEADSQEAARILGA